RAIAGPNGEPIVGSRIRGQQAVGRILDLDEAPVVAQLKLEAAVVGGKDAPVERFHDAGVLDQLAIVPPAAVRIEADAAVLAGVAPLPGFHRTRRGARAGCSSSESHMVYLNLRSAFDYEGAIPTAGGSNAVRSTAEGKRRRPIVARRDDE